MACSCGGGCSSCSRGGRVRRRYRNGGLITRGSGRIDPSTGNLRLTVDDVPARVRETGEPLMVGNNEYIINSGAVRQLGLPFLDNLNAVGLGTSTLRRGTGHYGNYQRGGIPRRRYSTGGRMMTPDVRWKRRHKKRKKTRGPIRGRQRGGLGSMGYQKGELGPNGHQL